MIDLNPPIILSVGALTEREQHDLSIKAVAKLLKGSLLIIGDGKKKKELEQLGLLLLGKQRFKILDADYRELPKYYRSAKIFTLPCRNGETAGSVYREALAANLPVVAPDDPSRQRIIGEKAGELVDVYDPQRFALALAHSLAKDYKDEPRKQADLLK